MEVLKEHFFVVGGGRDEAGGFYSRFVGFTSRLRPSNALQTIMSGVESYVLSLASRRRSH
eukprot:scaffold5410_cov112-Skeletonema_menzelii.AAC.4